MSSWKNQLWNYEKLAGGFTYGGAISERNVRTALSMSYQTAHLMERTS